MDRECKEKAIFTTKVTKFTKKAKPLMDSQPRQNFKTQTNKITKFTPRQITG